MDLYSASLSHKQTPIELREALSFASQEVPDACRRIAAEDGITGAVLLSTCNRTELYVTAEKEADVPELLCRAAGLESREFRPYFECFRNEKSQEHLFRVACGLCSAILGDDQILTQVKQALQLAHDAGTSNAELETLFRTASTCGKQAKTAIRLTAVPPSMASRAVDELVKQVGDPTGKRALVIGNGEMGRLSGRLLNEAGFIVTVTLRTYRHGETVVPAGCHTVDYEDRYLLMNYSDVMISATTSPHFTVDLNNFSKLKNPPKAIVDLAIPRDIQPEIGALPGIRLMNVDDLGGGETDEAQLAEVQKIMSEHLQKLRNWQNYRAGMVAQQEVKNAIAERLHPDDPLDENIIDRTVDLLLANLPETPNAESLMAAALKIRLHTR